MYIRHGNMNYRLYRCEDRKDELKGEVGAISKVWIFQKSPSITCKKWTVQPGDAFEDTAVESMFEIVKF